MALVASCIRGQMGNTTYYLATMKVRDLVLGVRPPRDMDTWANMSIEERMQRELNEKRVKEEISPYLTQNKDRFFGSILVLVYKGEIFFENFASDLKVSLPRAYRVQGENIGFLTIDGGTLIVLDGQHRLSALEQVFKGEVEGEYALDVPNDEVSVIFIDYETPEKTRRLFSRLNRYAKPTSRADNIITDEDNGNAIITRRLLGDDAPLGSKDTKGDGIVEWKNNTLTARSTKLTTISAVNEIVKAILDAESEPIRFPDKSPTRPSDEQIDTAYEIVERFWNVVLNNLQPFSTALDTPSDIPKMREESSRSALLFKPASQIAFFQGLLRTLERSKGRLTLEEVVKRANNVDWSMTASQWRDIIVNANTTIIASKDAREPTTELIAYLIGADVMDAGQIAALEKIYNERRGEEVDVPLPEPVAATR